MTQPVQVDETTDVVVVGGGLSGILVAERIAAAGLDCLVLEAGPVLDRRLPSSDLLRYREAIAPLLDVDEARWAYRVEGLPYDWIRVRAGGGRSLLWGGWALRPQAESFADAEAYGRPWPVGLDDLTWHLQKVERLLGVREAPLDPCFARLRDELGIPVAPKRAAAGPCGCRAFVSLDWLRRARLRPNAVALRVLLDRRDRRARGVELVDALSGARSVVRARTVVLSASPIETARLLLASAAEQDLPLPAAVGRGLVDHLVASCLLVLPEPAPDLTPATPFARAAFVPRFANLGDERRDYRGGFSVELHGPDSLGELAPETLAALGLPAAGAAGHSFYALHAIGEAAPHPGRFVELSPTTTDAFGRRVPLIHQAWGEEEPRMARDMEETIFAIADALATPGSRIYPVRETLRPGGIAHEAGTCRLGLDPEDSAVDLTGQVHGLRGLYVADGSLMPTALDRPPTLVALALALSTAVSIVEAAGRGEL